MRSHPVSVAAAVALFASLSPRSLAGDVLVVRSNGPYTTIQAAVDAAQDYDTVLVKPNPPPAATYPGFTINGKSIAVVGQTFVVGFPPRVWGEIRVQAVSSEKLALITGLDVRGTSATSYALMLLGNGGSVRVERCTLTGLLADCNAASGPCAWIGTDDDPQFVGTSFFGGEPFCQTPGSASGRTALFSRSPMLQLFGCSIEGGDGASVQEDDAWAGGGGGRGLEVPDGITVLVGTTVRGGNGGNGDYQSHWGCLPGGAGGSGGHGVVVGSSPPSGATPNVRALGGSVAGGAAGLGGGSECGPNGWNGTPGSATVVFNGSWTPLPGVARYIDGVPLVRENNAATLVATGAPGDRVFITIEDAVTGASLVVATGAHTPLTSLTKPLGPTLFGTIGPSGTLTAMLPISSLMPGVQSRWWRIESMFVDSSGTRHPGNEFVFVVIDSAF